MNELTELQDKANDAFYAWEIANNEQDLSDDDRMLWTAGWIYAQLTGETNETS
jgi:hypothetical protein